LRALMGAVFWLTLGGENKTFDRYRVYFHESVAGLNPKATVRYRGVQVGQVQSIRLDPNPDQVDVVLGIERGTPIRRDTIATLSTRGLTGVASVELSGGGNQSPLEKEAGQDLPVIQAGPSLVARLDDAFNNILTNVNNLSSRLERLLGDENQTALTEILQHLEHHHRRGGRTLRQHPPDADERGNLHRGPWRGARNGWARRWISWQRVGGNRRIERPGAGDALGDFRAAAQSVRKTADTFNQTSRDLSGLAEVGRQELRRLGQSTEPELSALLAQASDMVTALQRLAELLEQNPRALLLGKPSGRPGPGENERLCENPYPRERSMV
jgi:phospholipid/cholesterol/gamma-HCH transport system substrate-binding protein